MQSAEEDQVMATRILGPTGSKRRKRFLLVPILLVAFTALFLVGSAQAVHDLQFQLDGNAKAAECGTTPDGNCSTQQYDWDSVFNANGTTTSLVNPSNTSGFTNAAFQRDFGLKVSATDKCNFTSTDTTKAFCTADPTTYATGSKDTLDIGGGGWQCNKDNNVNSKIDIMNAYSAAYTASNGDKIIYFGMDKNKDNGNNNVGFWFLQGNADCTSSGSAVNWTGNHQDGDILVTSAFTSGGGVSSILVFRWAGGASGCLDSHDNPDPHTGGCDQLPIGSGGDCKTAPSAGTAPVDSICATTNSGPHPTNTNIQTPWLTADATLGVGHTVVPPDFFEGGIDITKVFGSAGGSVPSCFNTFVGDTRSSQQPTATLFDYARGQLGECSVTMTTAPSSTANRNLGSTTSITDTATVTGHASGGGTAPAPTGTVDFFLCGPSDLTDPTTGLPSTTGTCNGTSGTEVPAPPTEPVAVTPVANTSTSTATSGDAQSLLTTVGKYCFRAHFVAATTDQNYTGQTADLAATDEAVECFNVVANASTSTAQKWLPQDTATVTATGGATVAGTVTFQLYESTDCSGSAVQTLGPYTVDANGQATTVNTTYYAKNIQISWKATFTSTNSVGSGSPAPCERSDIANLDNDITTP
jgi:hypothetical protein